MWYKIWNIGSDPPQVNDLFGLGLCLNLKNLETSMSKELRAKVNLVWLCYAKVARRGEYGLFSYTSLILEIQCAILNGKGQFVKNGFFKVCAGSYVLNSKCSFLKLFVDVWNCKSFMEI